MKFRHSRQGDPRQPVLDALDEAEEALTQGRVDAAVSAYRRGTSVVRRLAVEDPHDDDHRQQLGSMLYSMASLLVAEHPREAVEALDEAEEAYRGLRTAQAAGQVADVQMRRASAHLSAGAGASALVDADSATVTHLDLAGGRETGPAALDRARVLARQAEVSTRFGDPDIGVAAADAAVRTYLNNAAAINASPALAQVHQPAFARAAHIAAIVHAAFGRTDVAGEAGDLAAQVDLAGVVRRTIRVGGPAEVASRLTLAAALGRADALGPAATTARLGGPEGSGGSEPAADPARSRADDLRRRLTAPVLDVSLVTSTQRSDGAVLPALELASLGAAVIGADPRAGLRIGLEAHVILAGASRRQVFSMRQGFAHAGPPWAETLLACARQAWADGEAVLADDLASWMLGVCGQLAHIVWFDDAAKATSVACATWLYEFADATGNEGRKADATAALDFLTGKSPR